MPVHAKIIPFSLGHEHPISIYSVVTSQQYLVIGKQLAQVFSILQYLLFIRENENSRLEDVPLSQSLAPASAVSLSRPTLTQPPVP